MRKFYLLSLFFCLSLLVNNVFGQCRITGWSYMANKTTACDSFRTFNIVILDSPMVYKPGTVGQIMVVGPNKKVTTSAIGGLLKAQNGLRISNDTAYWGGTLSSDSTGIGFNPRYKKLYFGNDTSFALLGYGSGAPVGETVFAAYADIAAIGGYDAVSLYSTNSTLYSTNSTSLTSDNSIDMLAANQLTCTSPAMQFNADSVFASVTGKMSIVIGTTFDLTSQSTAALFSPVSAGLNSYTNSDRQQASIVANNGGPSNYPAVISEARVLGQYATGFYAQVDTHTNTIFSNIYAGYFGEDSIRDITQWWVQVDKIHGRIYNDTVTLRYNGAEIKADYVQLEIDKYGEDGSASGELWRGEVHGGYGLWSSGAQKLNIDTFGNISFLGADSATLYALTPANMTLASCDNCSGNGILGRLLIYLGGAWRRLAVGIN